MTRSLTCYCFLSSFLKNIRYPVLFPFRGILTIFTNNEPSTFLLAFSTHEVHRPHLQVVEKILTKSWWARLIDIQAELESHFFSQRYQRNATVAAQFVRVVKGTLGGYISHWETNKWCTHHMERSAKEAVELLIKGEQLVWIREINRSR